MTELQVVQPMEAQVAAPPQQNTEGEQGIQSQTEQRLDALTPRERLIGFLKHGMQTVSQKHAAGGYDSNDESKTKAEQTMQYENAQTLEEGSPSIRALLDTLQADSIADDGSVTDENIKRTHDEIAKRIGVKVGESIMTLEELQAERARAELAQDTDRLSELDGGVYGFVLPQEEQQVPVAAEQPSAAQEIQQDSLLASHRSSLEQRIVEAKARGENTKKQEQLLITVRLAESANGEIGGLLKLKALKDLKTSGIQGLDREIQQLEATSSSTKDVLINHLRSQGMSESDIVQLSSLVDTAGLDGLIQGDLLDNAGVDQLIFGRSISEGELAHLIDTALTSEQKNMFAHLTKKKVGLALLIAMLLAGALPMAAMQQMSGR